MLFLSLMVAAGALAQQNVGLAPEAEYGRVSGGEINLMVKSDQRPFSGSLSLIGSGRNGKGYGATLGATIVPDKMWFFGSIQQTVPYQGIDAKLTGQLGDRQNLVASYANSRQQQSPVLTDLQLPSSFLSLHYTGIISDNMFVTASFSKRDTK